jgi:hypothetical protein
MKREKQKEKSMNDITKNSTVKLQKIQKRVTEAMGVFERTLRRIIKE